MSEEKKINIEDGDLEEAIKKETMEQPTSIDEETVEQDEQEVENEEEPEAEEEEEKDPLEAAQEENAKLRDQLLRTIAEFENYKKRTLKEKAELILNGSEKAFKAILPVVDDMERALATMQKATDVEAVKEGVELIYNKFIQILGQNGVQAMDTKEKELDTDFHDAIAIIDAPSEELKGKILDCVETGYTLNDKVLRHAKVVVGK